MVYRLFNPVPQKVLDELMEKLPDFKRGYLEDGLEDRGVRATSGRCSCSARCSPAAGRVVLGLIKERRAALR